MKTTRVDKVPVVATAEVATPIPATEGVDRSPTLKHQMKPTCWCQPTVTYEDPLSGNRVYTHKATLA